MYEMEENLRTNLGIYKIEFTGDNLEHEVIWQQTTMCNNVLCSHPHIRPTKTNMSTREIYGSISNITSQ
jgi:hypothetical protein